jgi:Leucine Rich Repeat
MEDAFHRRMQTSNSSPQRRAAGSGGRVCCDPTCSAAERGLRLHERQESSTTLQRQILPAAAAAAAHNAEPTNVPGVVEKKKKSPCLASFDQIWNCHAENEQESGVHNPSESDSSSSETTTRTLPPPNCSDPDAHGQFSGTILIFATERGASDLVPDGAITTEDDFYRKLMDRRNRRSNTAVAGRDSSHTDRALFSSHSGGGTNPATGVPATTTTGCNPNEANTQASEIVEGSTATVSTATPRRQAGNIWSTDASEANCSTLTLAHAERSFLLSPATLRTSQQTPSTSPSSSRISGFRTSEGNPDAAHEPSEDSAGKARLDRVARAVKRCEASAASSCLFLIKKRKRLVLSGMQLTVADMAPIKDLRPTIHTLCLSGNPGLGFGASLPKVLTRALPHLTDLDLSHCELMHLPSTWKLPKLKHLNLSQNILTEFPEEVSSLVREMYIYRCIYFVDGFVTVCQS